MADETCTMHTWSVGMPDGSTRSGAAATRAEAQRASADASVGFSDDPQEVLDNYAPMVADVPAPDAPDIDDAEDPLAQSVPYSAYTSVPVDDARLDDIRSIHNVSRMSPPSGATGALLHPDHANPQMLGAVVVWETPNGKRAVYSQYHQRTSTSMMHERRRAVVSQLPALDKAVRDAMRTDDSAAAVAVMRFGGIRVDTSGGKVQSKNSQAKPIYGAVSLQARHVAIHDGVAYLRFLGKQQRVNTATIKDPEVVSMLAERLKGKKADDPLFPKATPAGTSAIIKQHLSPDSTNHDMRRQYASARAAKLIQQMPTPTDTGEYIDARNTVAKEVGALINDNPGIALERYIDTTLFNPWREAIGISPVSGVEHEAPGLPADADAPDLRKKNLRPSSAQLAAPAKLFADDGDGMFSTLTGWAVKRSKTSKKGANGKVTESVRWFVYPPGRSGRPSTRSSADYATKTEAQEHILGKTPARVKNPPKNGGHSDAYLAPADFGKDWGMTDTKPVEDHTKSDILPSDVAGSPGGDILASAAQQS